MNVQSNLAEDASLGWCLFKEQRVTSYGKNGIAQQRFTRFAIEIHSFQPLSETSNIYTVTKKSKTNLSFLSTEKLLCKRATMYGYVKLANG